MLMRGSFCPPASVSRIHALAVGMKRPLSHRLTLIAGAQTQLSM